VNNWTAVSEAVDEPLANCEGLVGFSQEDIANNVRPNVRALDRIKRNVCGEKSSEPLIDFGSDTI
jgi:hypothetical protein